MLAQPRDVIKAYAGFSAFAAIGDHRYWMWRSIAVAFLASCSPFRLPFLVREAIIGVQASWLVVLAALFSLNSPITTGAGAYSVFAYFALYLGVICCSPNSAKDGVLSSRA